MPKRVSIRTIAKQAGVHHSTVSLAMHKHPSIPLSTRERILKIADDLGYRPDPMMSALSAYRREIRPPKYRATVAWITNFATRDEWKQYYSFREIFDGATERAGQLGYKLDPFWLRESGMTVERATRVLTARNISGLLIAPQGRSYARLRLDWSRFSAIAIGYTLTRPALHLVTNQHFGAVTRIMHRLRSLGYRRIGLVISNRINERLGRQHFGAYQAGEMHLASMDQIAPLIFEGADRHEAFRAWFRTHRPEAIIAHETDILDWLKAEGIDVPGDVGVAFIGLPEDQSIASTYSGIFPKSREMGMAAMDFLATLLNRREQGIPEVHQSLLIQGVWQDGTTTRRVNR